MLLVHPKDLQCCEGGLDITKKTKKKNKKFKETKKNNGKFGEWTEMGDGKIKEGKLSLRPESTRRRDGKKNLFYFFDLQLCE